MKYKSGSSLMLAIMWSFVLLTDVICAALGNEPDWVLVFCPLTILVFDRWTHYAEDLWKEAHK